MFAAIHAPGNLPVLLDCARQFSPLVEITSEDTVTFDVRGLNRLHGSLSNIANEIDRVIGIPANIAIAANPDTAVHASRGIAGITVVAAGQETQALAGLSLHLLGCPSEMGETFQLWGIRTFGQFAQLPPLGVAARLGQEGTYWQQMAQGAVRRQLRPVGESVSFARQMELDHPILLLEPLLFLLGRFLHELCTELISRSLATNEVRLRLRLDKGAEHSVTLRLPVATADQKMLLKLLAPGLERAFSECRDHRNPPCNGTGETANHAGRLIRGGLSVLRKNRADCRPHPPSCRSREYRQPEGGRHTSTRQLRDGAVRTLGAARCSLKSQFGTNGVPTISSPAIGKGHRRAASRAYHIPQRARSDRNGQRSLVHIWQLVAHRYLATRGMGCGGCQRRSLSHLPGSGQQILVRGRQLRLREEGDGGIR